MTSNSSKAFGPIREDYAFFEEHATEAERDVQAYLPHLQQLISSDSQIRMLDFGCGEGKFTSRLLDAAGFVRDRLELSLVEPDEVYRRRAVARLGPLSAHPVSAWPALPSGLDGCFDLVLSNHVFYYVAEIDDALAAIRGALAPAGLFLAAMAGQENLLIQIWNHAFGLLGKPVPFHTAENFAAALVRQRMDFVTEDVDYELAFSDTEEHRLKILRFLLGSHFREMPRQAILDVFNAYSADGRIAMRIVHKHFAVQCANAPPATDSLSTIMERMNEAILAFDAWETPWRFAESVMSCPQLSPNDRTLFAQIWGAATDASQWKSSDLAACCEHVRRALRQRFPKLSDESAAQIVRAASYPWR